MTDTPERTATAARLAGSLWDAWRGAVPIPPVRHLIGDGDIDLAYAAQGVLTERRLAEGARIMGRKIGLTSPAVQAQLGVDQPDFGVLFDDMSRREDESIDLGGLIAPKVEVELAFILARDLDDEHLTLASVRDAVEHVVPALEIVDSRIEGWDISITDTIADNASSALFILGEPRVPLGDLRLADVGMEMSLGGEVVSTGDGAACLGDPLNALLWLADTCRNRDAPLRAGEVVLSGALGPMVPVASGREYTAVVSGIGVVRASFQGTPGQRRTPDAPPPHETRMTP